MKKKKPYRSGKSRKNRKSADDFYHKMLIAQEEEKKRISRDLHDEAGQMAVALAASMDIIEKEIKKGNSDKAFSLLKESRNMVQDIVFKMKSMALNLRPPALDLLGLSAALREYLSQCTKTNNIRIEFKENTKDIKFDERIEIALYRIVQEAICNAIKHAKASLVKIDLLLAQDRIKLIVEDNGKGFDVSGYRDNKDTNKLGLRGVQERVDAVRGYFAINSSEKGTKLTIILPQQIKL
ncbi:MAG: hypothetical protein GF375_02470 [Candidatus Omnitrophica bacterium]|nr:hypothetical protein [Candidatus Omnitrophota bacterium]MBD3268965.1 hypothetical protein [Candidatus Omnitrophota bacterium]